MEYSEQKVQQEYEPIKGGKRTTFEQERGRFKFTPGYNLLKTLEKYPNDFTKERRYEIQTEYEDFPSLGVLNLNVFVSVLLFLEKFPEPKPNDFKDEVIVKYFIHLLPEEKKISSEEKKRLIFRFKAQFLKYIIALNNFKANREEIFEEETKRKMKEDEDEEDEKVLEEEEYETDEEEYD